MARSTFTAAEPGVPGESLRGGRGLPTLAAAAAVGVFWFVYGRDAWSQAGFLHLAFARSLAERHIFGVGGRAVYGDGAPLWVFLLAGTHALLRPLTADWMVAGQALTAAAAVFFAAGLYRFARTLPAFAERSTPAAGAALVVLLVLLSPYWGIVAFSGSEILAAAGLACWGLAAVEGTPGSTIRVRRLLAGCACAGLGPLLRPEMLFLSLCLGPLLFFRWVNTPWPFRRKLGIFVAGMLLAVAPGAASLLSTVRHFGTALPNTLAAGQAAPGASVLGSLLAGFCVACPWVLCGVFGLAAWGALRRAGRSEVSGVTLRTAVGWNGAVPVLWAVLVAIFYLATHTAIRAEQVMLTAPALTASAVAATSRLWPRFERSGMLAAVVYGLAMSALFTWPTVRVNRRETRVYSDLAAAVRSLPGAARLALAPAGEVAFLSEHPVADLGGTLDPGALPFRWDAADDRRVWWAHEQGARYMVLDHAPEPGSELVWSGNVPAAPTNLQSWQKHGFDRLMLWQLPPSPTLPQPTILPDHVD